MKRMRIALVLSLGLWGSALGQYFPHVALGEGYEVIVLVTNKLDTTFTGGLRLHFGNSEGWQGAIEVNGEVGDPDWIAIDLQPLATTRIRIRGDEALRAGYLTVWGAGVNSGTDVAISLFYNFVQGNVLKDSTGIPVTWVASGHLFGVEKSAAVNTAFAWSRISPTNPFEITLELYDESGEIIQTKILEFEGHLARFFDEVFDSVPNPFVGHMRIIAPKPVAIAVLRLEMVGQDFQLTSTPPTTFTPESQP